MYVSFMDLEKTCDREASDRCWECMMFVVSCCGIKIMYVDSLACYQSKKRKSNCYDRYWGETCVSCPLGFSMYIWMQ